MNSKSWQMMWFVEEEKIMMNGLKKRAQQTSWPQGYQETFTLIASLVPCATPPS